MFCRHNWEIIESITTTSKFEHAMNAAKEVGVNNCKIPWQLCDGDRKVIQVVHCTKCGKIKKFVTDI